MRKNRQDKILEPPGQPFPFATGKPPADSLPSGLFAQTVLQAPVAISITDEQANIVYVNQAFTDITGYPPAESIGRNESMLSYKKTPKRVYHELWNSLKKQRPWQGRLLNRHRDGHAYLAELTVAPILDQAGKTTHYIGMHRDVTEVYQLQQQTNDQKLLIETMVDAMPMATVLLDETGRIVLDNLAYKKLDSDLGVREPSRLFLDIISEELGADWERLRESGQGFRNREIRYERGGRHEPRWFACSGIWFRREDESVDAFFREHAHTYLLLTLDDITLQKKHEAEIRLNALKSLMSEEEKIQSLRETLWCAMHHIQAPMNLLSAARNLLARRDQERQNPALLEILEQVLAAGEASLEHMKACVPVVDAVSLVPVNINQLLHETLALLTQPLLAAGVVIDWRPTAVLPTVMGMETRLRAMFKLILENAIDAMNQGGILVRELRVATWADDELVHIEIEDTGPGIPEGLRVKAFEPFFSTKNVKGQRHQGMGLTMAREVVNQHAGLIEFDPAYQNGCRVHIQFQTHARLAPSENHYAHG